MSVFCASAARCTQRTLPGHADQGRKGGPPHQEDGESPQTK